MKSFIFLFCTSVFSLSSGDILSQNATINIDSDKTVTVDQVFDIIMSQTDYKFIYQEGVFENQPKVQLKKGKIKANKLLEQSLQKGSFLFDFSMQNTIVIKKKESKSVANQVVQQRITGRVTDEDGVALMGVSVLVNTSERGVATDINGNYSIEVKKGDVVSFSYVGFVRQEFIISNQTVLNVSLKEDFSKLEEVVLISTGYQRIVKDQMTGAAAGISEEQYQQREAVTGNFLESLEGKVPGLVYNDRTGELTIRGVSTFDAVKQPLIVLDGFPTEIDLRTINPNDIVSVNVLRDAAAASIYGVRASNGVIIIETRRGKTGKPVFTFQSTYAIQNKPDFGYLNYADASEVVQLQKDKFTIANPSYFLYQIGLYKMNPVEEIMFGGTQLEVSNPLLTPEQIEAKLTQLGSYDNRKEYEDLFYQARQTQNINFDMSGGSAKATYFLGINYIDETPVERRSKNRQLSINMANTFEISDRFNLDFKGTYTNTYNKRGKTPPLSDFFPYERLTDDNGNALAVRLSPGKDYITYITDAVNNQQMDAGLYDQLYYPYNELFSNTDTNRGSAVRFQARLNTKISEWLNLDIDGNYENQHATIDQLQLEGSYALNTLLNSRATVDPATGNAIFNNLPKGNILKQTHEKTSNYTLRAQLNFDHQLDEGKHEISGILGVEQRRTSTKGSMASYFGYDGQNLINKPVNLGLANATATPAFPNVGSVDFSSTDYFKQAESERRFRSFYGQATYIFNDKYIATGSFRIDKTNLFGADPKYRNKPLWSVGVNWQLGKEDVIQNVSWINTLALRASTGFNGNVPTSNNGPFLILNTGLNTTFDTPLIYNDVQTPENQSLRWETTQNYNIGLDFGLFRRHIYGSVDWYLKKTTDVFGLFDSDPTTGFNQYNANTASIGNKGLEFMVNAMNIRKEKFRWNTQLTANFNKNEVLKVKATEYSNSESITSGANAVKGKPLGAMYSFNYGGLNELGQPFVFDKEGNQNVLTYFSFFSEKVDVELEDLIYNGTTTPKYVLGLNNQFTFGDFDFSFLFMYYGGHVMRVEQPNPNNIGFLSNNPLRGASNFWKEPGDENVTRIPGFSKGNVFTPGYYQASALYGYQYASEFVRKADNIRLRDVILTYNVNGPVFDKMGLSNTKIRLQAQNVFRYTFSGNDIDPDAINRNTGVRILETQPFFSLTLSTNF